MTSGRHGRVKVVRWLAAALASAGLLVLAACSVFAAGLVLAACGDIAPVESVDLCSQDPPNADCAQCRSVPRDPRCPQCVDGGDGCAASDASARDDGGDGSASNGSDAALVGADASGGDAGGSDGGGGGGGGTGATIDCASASDCSAALPVCGAEGHCSGCGADTECTSYPDTPRCETRSESARLGSCVECRGDAQCGDAARSLCVDSACVECATHLDCNDAEKPQCASGTCVPCATSSACEDRAGTTLCDVQTGSPREGRCVQCVGHADCPNEAPACVDNSCGPCSALNGAAACAGRADGATPLTICNTREGVATSGECVQCTASTESTACGASACDQHAGRCTGTVRASLASCQACNADSECDDGAKCVLQEFGAGMLGPYCFFPQGSGCAGASVLRRPYSQAIAAESIDGVADTFCFPITTCQAIQDAASAKTCQSDDDCGLESTADGACIDTNRCSYACGPNDAIDSSCPSLGPSDCRSSFCQTP